MTRYWLSSAVLFFAVALAPLPLVARGSLPATWDNLVKIDSKAFAGVYVLPGADFRAYTKVMLDPTEVAFDKNWQRDFNNSRIGMRVTNEDVRKAADRAGAAFTDILTKAYTDAGYQVVTAPGDNVLRVSTAVINLKVSAPDTMGPGMVRSYSEEAGSATVVFEARDSMTGAILGRAVDARVAGDMSPFFIRNRATNTGDFKQLFRSWADSSTKGLAMLKTMSPVPAAPLNASQ
jgi:hypothetical protein